MPALDASAAVALTVILPALNEEDHLEPSATEAIRACEDAGLSFEMIIIDDGSTDATASIADRLAATDSRISVIHHPGNLGLGMAYRNGLAIARGTYITWVPGDLSHPAEGLEPVYRLIGTADIILPVPSNPKARNLGRRLVSRTYTMLLDLLFGLRVPYFNGLSVHRTDLLRGIAIRTSSFAFQAEIIIKLLKQGHSFHACPVLIAERTHGPSKAFRIKNVLAVFAAVGNLVREIHFK